MVDDLNDNCFNCPP